MIQETEEARKFLEDPEICIWIDRYDDVFSEFDSRPFSDRALSDDFLREVRKMAGEKSSDHIVLKFNVLDGERSEESEAIIINNLNHYFQNIADALKAEQRLALKQGYMLLGTGFTLIISLFYVTTLHISTAYTHGLNLMLEPVGWFMTWTGLDSVFQIAKKSSAALDFNSKMAEAKIKFNSLEETQTLNAEKAQKTVIPIDNNNLRVA